MVSLLNLPVLTAASRILQLHIHYPLFFAMRDFPALCCHFLHHVAGIMLSINGCVIYEPTIIRPVLQLINFLHVLKLLLSLNFLSNEPKLVWKCTHWLHQSHSHWLPPLPQVEELAGGQKKHWRQQAGAFPLLQQQEPSGLENLQQKSKVLHWLQVDL